MRRLLLITLIAGAAAIGQQAQTKDGATQGKAPGQAKKDQAPAKSKKLSRAEIDQLLARPEKVLFIDVRRPDEVSSIGGFAVYLSIQVADLEKHLAEIPKDRLIVTVSNHANRAVRAADLLDGKGFKVVGAAGVEDYEAEGGTPVKIAVPPPNANAGKQGAAKQ
jgi:rhodanese-related sulfurtransferase